MKKIIPILLLVISCICFSFTIKNQYQYDEIIKLKSKNNNITFPYFKYKNMSVSNKINETLLDSLKEKLDEQIKGDDINITIEKAAEKLDYCDYEISSLKNTVSLVLIFESSAGAYPTSWREYYNFSLTTGKLLSTKDLFLNKPEFLKRLKSKEKIYIQNYIKELKSPENDTDNVSTAIREMNEGCFKYIDDKFKISKDTLYFYPDYCMSHYMQNIEPYQPIKFSKKELKSLLKKEYQ